jgi:hypothetical protein
MYRIFVLLFLFIFSICKAQLSKNVPYSRDYEFKEGVYLSISQFKNNAPILKSDIESILPKDQIDFLTQVLEQKVVTYTDSAGQKQKNQPGTQWGYAQNRAIYINFNNEFNRMNVIGTLCLFSAMIVQSSIRNEPLGDMYAIQPSFQELRQYVLDTQTNKILDFDAKSMELLLKNDAVLYEGFMKLKKRAKADSIFIYLRKYNENHPLYLPLK